MAPDIRNSGELTTEFHAPPSNPEPPAPPQNERGFHLWLRSLYVPHTAEGLLIAALQIPTEQTALHSTTSLSLASHALGANIIMQAEYSLRPPEDYKKEQVRAWQRTDIRLGGNVTPLYRASEFHAGKEVLRISVQSNPGRDATPLLKSTATLRTGAKNALEIAEVELLVGSHTPFRELLPTNEDGFIRRGDIQNLLGHLAQDSQTILVA